MNGRGLVFVIFIPKLGAGELGLGLVQCDGYGRVHGLRDEGSSSRGRGAVLLLLIHALGVGAVPGGERAGGVVLQRGPAYERVAPGGVAS